MSIKRFSIIGILGVFALSGCVMEVAESGEDGYEDVGLDSSWLVEMEPDGEAPGEEEIADPPEDTMIFDRSESQTATGPNLNLTDVYEPIPEPWETGKD